MRVFLSHHSDDHPLADYLYNVLPSVGLDIFMLPEAAEPGKPWMETIRRGLQECEAIVSLITETSLDRPWIAAEWAAFWVQDKPYTTVVAGVGVAKVWDPMRANQVYDLLDVTQLSALLKRWADATSIQPTSGVVPLAGQVSKESQAILGRQRLQNLDAALTRITQRLRSGTDNLAARDIEVLVQAGRTAELIDLALSENTATVKRKQMAVGLVRSGRHGEALTVARAISNRNESANVAFAVIDNMPSTATVESEEWEFLIGIFDFLRQPQRRDVTQRLLNRGIAPLAVWKDYSSKPTR